MPDTPASSTIPGASTPRRTSTTLEVVGWLGAFAVVAMFALSSLKMLDINNVPRDATIYQAFNAAGSIGVAAVAISKRANQPAFINIVWSIVSIVALVRLLIA